MTGDKTTNSSRNNGEQMNELKRKKINSKAG